MGLLNRLFAFRWSLYLVHEGSLVYAMHEHLVLSLVFPVASYFGRGKPPLPPWELYLNFNLNNQTIKLRPEHFTTDGYTRLLIQEIAALDPDWKRTGGEPVFEEVATRRRLNINEDSGLGLQALIDRHKKPEELTFYSVMDRVFGMSAGI